MDCLICGSIIKGRQYLRRKYCSLRCKNRAPKNYNQTPRIRKYREEYNKKKDKPCMDCGNTFPPECMDFDHRPGEVKINSVTRMVLHTPAVLAAEIAKCDLVCANCHRIRTEERKREKRKMAPQSKTPKAVYNPEHGGSHLEIEPLDPRQGQPLDMTVPHAMDQTLAPPLKPGQQPTPVIGPPQGTPSDWEANPLILRPGEYTRPANSDLKKT